MTYGVSDDNPDRSTAILTTHLRGAIANAALLTDPGPYMVIPDLLPARTYKMLVGAIPPLEAFVVADRVKANFDPLEGAAASAASSDPWFWFHTGVVTQLITPILLEAFHPLLAATYNALFGRSVGEAALRLPHRAFRGRLMLRRPGYRLKPHRDMKIAALTGLIYFARPGDSCEYGTELYRVENDREAPFMKTYYPEDHGGRAELVRSIPFIGNAALIFMNVPGMAHGAGIPRDAVQAERYAYQFYIGPSKSKLARLVHPLPREQAVTWSLRLSGDDD